ncbi:MAG: hypothetical protein ACTHON_18210 [Humibacter sp.]
MSKSKDRGTAGETATVRYLQTWWPDVERRALSGDHDRGDIAGVPQTCIEVKAAKELRLAEWKRETLKEQQNAGTRYCMLVVKRFRKPVAEWDAYLPQAQFEGEQFFEGMTPWIRVDLQVAVALLRSLGC